MSGVKYHSKRNNIIPGAIPVQLPLETDPEENQSSKYHPEDYKGCFGFNETEPGKGVMYYSTGRDWVTMDRVPILKPSARTPTNSIERAQLRLTPFISGAGFETIVHTRTAFEIYLDAGMTIKYKTRYDFTVPLSFEQTNKLVPLKLVYNPTNTEYECGFLLSNKIDSSSRIISAVDISKETTVTKDILDKLTTDPSETDPTKKVSNYSLKVLGSSSKYQISLSQYVPLWSTSVGQEYNDRLGIVLIGSATIPGDSSQLDSITLDIREDFNIGFDFGQTFYWRGKYFGGNENDEGDADELYESVWSNIFGQDYPKRIEDPLPLTKNNIRTDRLEITAYDSAWVNSYAHNKTTFRIYDPDTNDIVAIVEKTECASENDDTSYGESLQSKCHRFLLFDEEIDTTENTNKFYVKSKVNDTNFYLEDGKTYQWDARYSSGEYNTEWTTKRSFITPEADFIGKLTFSGGNFNNTFPIPVFWNLSNISESNPLTIEFYNSSGSDKIEVEYNGEETDTVNFTTDNPDSGTSNVPNFTTLNQESEIIFRIKYRYYTGINSKVKGNNYIVLMTHVSNDATNIDVDPKYSENGMNFDNDYSTFIDYLTEVISFGKHFKLVRFSNCEALTKVPDYLPKSIISLARTFAGCTYFNQDLNNWDTSYINYTDPPTSGVWFDREFRETFKNARQFNGNISTWFISNTFNSELKDTSISCFGTFWNATSFNRDVSKWNVERVDDFSRMFESANAFNSNLSEWKPFSATSFSRMFANTFVFNSDLSTWITPTVTNLSQMFLNSREFNGNISTWDVFNVDNFTGMFQGSWKFNGNLSDWNINNSTRNVVMDDMFNDAYVFNSDISGWDTSRVISMNRMFKNSKKFNRDISTDNDKWNVSNVESMDEMFHSALEFNSNISGWDVRNVKSFVRMFYNCPVFDGSLNDWNFLLDGTNEVDQNMRQLFEFCRMFTGKGLDTWNVSRVYDVTSMFKDCSSFTGTTISNWNDNTSNIRSFDNMFLRCSSFNGNIGGWDTSSATSMIYMFYEASSFNQNLKDWNVSNVTNMSSMFNGATYFGDGDETVVENWKTTSLTNMDAMFYRCLYFDGILVSKPDGTWDVSKVTNLASTFRTMNEFTGKGLNTWVTSSNTSLNHTFANCYKLGKGQNLNTLLNTWNTSNVTITNRCFFAITQNTTLDRPGIENLNISSWDVTNCTSFYGMFEQSNFNGNISAWRFTTDTSKNIDFTRMFLNDQRFNRDLSGWNTERVRNMTHMFYDARVFNGNISSWNTSNVIDMSAMFVRALQFNQSISTWNTSNVTNMSYMFHGAIRFNQPINTSNDKTNWDVSNVTNMANMFFNAGAFNQSLSDWDVSKVTNMSFMFNMAGSFNNGDDSRFANWDVKNVLYMTRMFSGNSGTTNINMAFRQDISGWNYTKIQKTPAIQPFEDFLRNVILPDTGSVTVLDNLYRKFLSYVKDNKLGTGYVFHGGTSNKYSDAGFEAKCKLVIDYGWTFIDGGHIQGKKCS